MTPDEVRFLDRFVAAARGSGRAASDETRATGAQARSVARGEAALRRRVLRHLRSRGFLLPPAAVLLRACARWAYDAEVGEASHGPGGPRGPGGRSGRFEPTIEVAVNDVLEELVRAEDEGVPLEHEHASFYRTVALRLGVPVEGARRACCVLNLQDGAVRRTFRELVFEGGLVPRARRARSDHRSERLLTRARRALDAALQPRELPVPAVER